MTTPDVIYRCARCGADCGNGSVYDCVIVSDLDVENGVVVNMRFCRARYEGEEIVKGCDSAVFGPAALKHLRGDNDVHKRPVRGNPPPPPEIGSDDDEHMKQLKAEAEAERERIRKGENIPTPQGQGGPVEEPYDPANEDPAAQFVIPVPPAKEEKKP